MSSSVPPQGAGDGATIRVADQRYHLDEDYSDASRKAVQGCSERLRTGITKWSVSEADAQAIIATLRALSFPELVAALHALGETTDGSVNLLAKLYDRGFSTPDLARDWKRLVAEKVASSMQKGQLPDLAGSVEKYQKQYVPAKVLERGF